MKFISDGKILHLQSSGTFFDGTLTLRTVIEACCFLYSACLVRRRPGLWGRSFYPTSAAGSAAVAPASCLFLPRSVRPERPQTTVEPECSTQLCLLPATRSWLRNASRHVLTVSPSAWHWLRSPAFLCNPFNYVTHFWAQNGNHSLQVRNWR